jgi:hypothetical protein
VSRATRVVDDVLRLALRELRGGVRGFGVFLACLALGVAAIAGIRLIMWGLSLPLRLYEASRADPRCKQDVDKMAKKIK